jgi:pSer/pThr/pTyr-binding forkhead associated (FHA) protein
MLGRGNDAHVKISDISISRNHAYLKVMKNNEIWLEDAGSKFGSLFIQNEPIELTPKIGREYLQVGRSYLIIDCKFPSNM